MALLIVGGAIVGVVGGLICGRLCQSTELKRFLYQFHLHMRLTALVVLAKSKQNCPLLNVDEFR